MLRKLVVEAIGTFFLVLTIGLVVLESPAGALAPLAIGSVLMVMVYAGGHISGAHYNPAVTLGVFLRGRASAADLVGYPVAQVLAAAAAALLLPVIGDGAAPPAPLALSFGAPFVAELVFTFALVYVILNVATAAGTEGNSHYGLAIGFTLAVGAWSVGAISGGAFNPAVAVGLVLMGLAAPSSLVVYLTAQLLAGAAAALLFRALDLGDDRAITATPAEQAVLKGAAATD